MSGRHLSQEKNDEKAIVPPSAVENCYEDADNENNPEQDEQALALPPNGRSIENVYDRIDRDKEAAVEISSKENDDFAAARRDVSRKGSTIIKVRDKNDEIAATGVIKATKDALTVKAQHHGIGSVKIATTRSFNAARGRNIEIEVVDEVELEKEEENQSPPQTNDREAEAKKREEEKQETPQITRRKATYKPDEKVVEAVPATTEEKQSWWAWCTLL